eukprot:CAMPEP_0198144558 /NCGR_PEP_ID=MMETSP1443-20131203/16441_1 /TAXON_ID=186043 /ORGANISM="Entomoneis sp., Strain CCMP2396" /LENGTH=102 /DNA_ID=CAMNT_0043807965 /DNA_START=92 /DNA_END=400 /DNA_ORIENTATION=+
MTKNNSLQQQQPGPQASWALSSHPIVSDRAALAPSFFLPTIGPLFGDEEMERQLDQLSPRERINFILTEALNVLDDDDDLCDFSGPESLVTFSHQQGSRSTQ